jgi:cytochrome c oxidase subunit 4
MSERITTSEAIDRAQADPHQVHEHEVHGGPKVYALVLGGLLVLTAVTVFASTIHFGSGMANVIIAMLIASIKASLVALFFMHLRWDKPMNAVIFCSSLFFLGLFLIGCYTDTAARPPVEPTNLKAQPGTTGAGTQTPAGQLAPAPGHGVPGAMSPTGGGPAIPGASPEGAYGGAATGTARPAPAQPPHR